jgi:hypothetical protein
MVLDFNTVLAVAACRASQLQVVSKATCIAKCWLLHAHVHITLPVYEDSSQLLIYCSPPRRKGYLLNYSLLGVEGNVKTIIRLLPARCYSVPLPVTLLYIHVQIVELYSTVVLHCICQTGRYTASTSVPAAAMRECYNYYA